MEPAVVSSEWVRSRIAEGTQASKVVDCSWFLVPPSSPHRPVLTGAAYFDVDDVADRSEDKSPSPHMLPSPDQFAAWMDRHNITPDDHVLLYDHSNGLLTASARVWWTFRVFGHGRVSVLEGGYASWPAGVEIPAQWRIVAPSEAPSGAASYPASYHPELVWGQEDVLQHIVNADKKEDADVGRRHILLDARPAERFLGQADEPRRGVPSGSVPGSASFPFPQLFRKVERTNEQGEVEATVHLLKSREELVELFAQRGVPIAPADKSGETVVAAMCGSGVTACPLALVLYTFGRPDVPIYDGSWTEWAFTAHPKQHLQQLPPDVVPLRKYHH